MFSYRAAFWVLVTVIALNYAWKYIQSPHEASVKPPSKILLVTGGPGPYWESVKAGATAAANDWDLEVEVRMPTKPENLEEQMQILSTINAAQWAGIALSPLNAEQQTRLINQLAADTNVLTFDSDAPLSNRLGYVGTSNYGAGTLCARLVHEALPEGGKVAVLMANRTKANLLERQNGFEENLNRLLPGDTAGELGDYEIVDYLIDEGDSKTCAELIRQALSQHPEVACFVGMNARHGPILLEVLQELGKLGQVKLVTFDHDEETLRGLEDGHIFATIAQDPYNFGYESVRILSSRSQPGEGSVPVVGRGSWHVPTEVIRQESVQDFKDRLEQRMPREASTG